MEIADPDAIKHVLVGVEAASFHEATRTRWHEYGAAFAAILRFGAALPATDYVRALRLLSRIREQMTASIATVDALVVPTSVVTAPKTSSAMATVGGLDYEFSQVVARNTSIFNICGLPALTVPCGFDSAGLPVGLQVITGHNRDDLCVRIGTAFQARTAHHLEPPPLCASSFPVRSGDSGNLA